MILLSSERSGHGFANINEYGYRYGDGNGYGNGYGYWYGNGYGNGYGYWYGNGNGRTNSTVTTNTLHSATVLAVATQLITYYGGRWV